MAADWDIARFTMSEFSPAALIASFAAFVVVQA